MKRKNTPSNNKALEKKPILLSPLQSILKKRILQPGQFYGFQKERENIKNLFVETVWNDESNSALLIGPAGCGKTSMVRNILAELSRKEKRFRDHAVMVWLNGLIHTDDRLALIAISRQMHLENVVEDRVMGTFADNLALLLETLKNTDQDKAIIFILDDVGLFCDHPHQTLLYNLFDIAHSNKASVCVLGITSKLDVLGLMEKRVKSRFSHRHVHLLPHSDDAAFEESIVMCRRLLTLERGDLDCFATEARWNRSVDSLLSKGETPYMLLQRLFAIDSSQQNTKDFLLRVVCSLEADRKELKTEDFSLAYEDVTGDDRMRMAEGLSVPEICLVIAMKQLNLIYQDEPVNFEMAFRRYNQYEKRHSSMQETSREVMRKAFEHLQALQLVIPVKGVAGRAQRDFQLHHFQLLPLQVDDLIRKSKDLPAEVINWSGLNVV
ncbi:hypothetical protein B566_EDAN012038 [Ephemera danica]|nr:hypothetical protein B566_EDAN012038 [Ephemera danica]